MATPKALPFRTIRESHTITACKGRKPYTPTVWVHHPMDWEYRDIERWLRVLSQKIRAGFRKLECTHIYLATPQQDERDRRKLYKRFHQGLVTTKRKAVRGTAR